MIRNGKFCCLNCNVDNPMTETCFCIRSHAGCCQCSVYIRQSFACTVIHAKCWYIIAVVYTCTEFLIHHALTVSFETLCHLQRHLVQLGPSTIVFTIKIIRSLRWFPTIRWLENLWVYTVAVGQSNWFCCSEWE